MTGLWLAAALVLAKALAVGAAILAVGWLVARKARPEFSRIAAGWSLRAAVLAVGLCALPSWIGLVPSPDFARAEKPTTVAVTVDASSIADRLVADVTDDQGQWQIVTVPVEVPEWEADCVPPTAVTFDATPQAEATPVPPSAKGAEMAAWGDVGRIVLLAYGVGVAVALIQLVLAQVAVGRIVLAAADAPGRVRDLFAVACDRAGVRARLLLSSRVTSPVCFGLMRPTVVLPKSFAQTAYDAELDWVFAHELAHLARGDHRLVWWVGFARAFFFPVPVFWALRRQLCLAQEYLADAAAAAVGEAAEYAQFLVSLSTGPAGAGAIRHPLTATGVKAGRSDLFRRVSMLVSNDVSISRRPSRRAKILIAGGTLGAAVLLSGLGFAAEPPKPTETAVAKAEPEWIAKVDDQDAKKAEEAKARAAELRAKADKARADAEKAMRDAEKAQAEAAKAQAEANKDSNKARVLVVVEDKAVEEAKKALAEAVKKGDVEAAQKAAEKFAQAKSGAANRIIRSTLTREGQPLMPLPPGVPAPPMAPRVQMWQNNSDASKQAMERGLAQFKQAMEKVKDNPEAKAEIEKAMKAFEKGMAEAMKAMPKSVEGFNLQEFKAPLAVQGFDMPQGAMMFAPARSGAGGEGRLGITIEPIGPGMAEQLDLPKGVGVVVSSVLDGTPAAKAGMKKGDIVLEFAGKPVPGEPGDVVKLIGQVKKDEKVNVIILRKGKKETLKDVTLPEAKAKVRVLEALPENFQFNGPGIQAFEFQAKNAEDLQREMARVQQEIEKLGGQGGAVKNQSLSVQVNDDVVTINADRDGVKYALTGATDGTFSSIVVKDGDETIKAKSIDELPTKHKEAVQSMLKNVRIKK